MSTSDQTEELFNLLESSQASDVTEIRNLINEELKSSKESWLVSGLSEYYLNTNSARCLEVLVSIKDPHDKYLLDQCCNYLHNSNNNYRFCTLDLLGQLIKMQSKWAEKIVQHKIFRELLKLLKIEDDIPLVVCILLVLMSLLPMVPCFISQHLNDIFIIFSRVASWTSVQEESNSPVRLHLHVTLFALFHRLYSMFPCNFLSYLRQHYSHNAYCENLHQCSSIMKTFVNVIEPMLRLVRMHPNLVVASKDGEMLPDRWKHLETHDIIAEYEKLSLDSFEGISGEWSQQNFVLTQPMKNTIDQSCGVENTNSCSKMYAKNQNEDITTVNLYDVSIYPHTDTIPQSPFFQTPTVPVIQSQPATPLPQNQQSPPEAAVEATPENTPIKPSQILSRKLPTTSVARELQLNNDEQDDSTPASPVKTVNPFQFDQTSTVEKKIQNLMQERIEYQAKEGKLQISESTDSKLSESTKKNVGISDSCNISNPEESSIKGEDMFYRRNSLFSDCYRSDHLPLEKSNSSGSSQYNSATSDEETIQDTLSHSSMATMTSSHSMMEFTRCVERIRFHSLCGPPPLVSNLELKPDSSDEEPSAAGRDRVRSLSAPSRNEAKKNLIQLSASVPFSGSESNVPDHESLVGHCSFGTQTIDNNTGLTPYERLFSIVFTTKTSIDSSCETIKSPQNLLHSYLKSTINENDPAVKDKKPSLSREVNILNQHLLYERHKRQLHMERNRRFLSNSKTARILTEHNMTLKDQLGAAFQKISSLTAHIETLRLQSLKEKENYCENLHKKEESLKSYMFQIKELREEVEKKHRLVEMHLTDKKIMKEKFEQLESAVCISHTELEQKQSALAQCSVLQQEVDALRRQLLILGEVNQRCQSQLRNNASNDTPIEEIPSKQIVDSNAKLEISQLKTELEDSQIENIAFKDHIHELEQLITKNEHLVTEQKRILKETKEIHAQQLQATEEKYSAVCAVNLQLQKKLMESRSQVQLSKARIHQKSGSFSINGYEDVSSCNAASSLNSAQSLDTLVDLSNVIEDE